jgi:ketosteroid isomerase-like protein
MGAARDRWEELSAAYEQQDDDTIVKLYAPDALWLEPHNPPHESNLLIQAYLASWLQAREDIDVTTSRLLESSDGSMASVEWTISFTAAGRRWNNLVRSTWFDIDPEGLIRYQRDYF